MKLYLLTQDKRRGYDTYSGAVVAAKTPKQARSIEIGSTDLSWGSWAKPKDVKATFLGNAKRGTKHGTILTSFHAGY